MGYQYIVTGHTASDRAETLLYNLIRGSGADGLKSLTWQRPLTPAIQLVRPLLEINRAETAQFCQDLQIAIWEDSTNIDLKYALNFSVDMGAPAKSFRMALGALIIKERLGTSDRETMNL